MPATDPIPPPSSGPYAVAAARPPLAGVTASGTVSLDMRARQHARSLPGPFRYELKGVTFDLPSLRSLPLAQWERLRGGTDPLAALTCVLGEVKLKEMTAAGFTLGDLEVIVEDWERRSGVRY